MPPQRGKFRKREILFAVAMGGLAAGGTALTLSAFDYEGGPAPMEVASGPEEQDYIVEPFAKISTKGPQSVEIKMGDKILVRAEGSPEQLARIEAVVENGRLMIRPKADFHWTQWGMLDGVNFYVTLPRLEAITLAGEGDVSIDRIEVDNFEATLGGDGDGDITIGDLKADQVSLTVTGSGDLTVAGIVRNAQIHATGGGDVQAGGLRATTASVTVFDSDVSLIVEDEAEVSVTGSGDVAITGPGICAVTRYGPAEVRCSGGGSVTND